MTVKRGILGHVADACARRMAVANDVEAINANGASARPEIAGENAQNGGLARAVGAEQPQHLSVLYLEGDAVHGSTPAVTFTQPFERNDSHPRFSIPPTTPA